MSRLVDGVPRKVRSGELYTREQSAIIGRNLRALRLRTGTLQSEVAKIAGWSGPSIVSRREKGTHCFREREAELIAAYFGVPVSTLISGSCANCEGNPPPGFTCQACGADRALARKDER